jgi:hypothetical protein
MLLFWLGNAPTEFQQNQCKQCKKCHAADTSGGKLVVENPLFCKLLRGLIKRFLDMGNKNMSFMLPLPSNEQEKSSDKGKR